MWPQIDMRAYRREHLWRVEETDEFTILIDTAQPDPDPEDLNWLIEHADHLIRRIRSTLKMEVESIKDEERTARVNLWVYSPEVLRSAGLVKKGTPHMFYGTANANGVHLARFNMVWNESMVVDKVTHEMVHYLWCDDVGEAPSLLNEGVATYFECLLANDAACRREKLISSWQKYAAEATPGFLRRLCRNDAFWAASGASHPVYSVGAEFFSFLLDNHGMQSVKRIFLNSHFDDLHLARRIEDVTGESVDTIEQRISARLA